MVRDESLVRQHKTQCVQAFQQVRRRVAGEIGTPIWARDAALGGAPREGVVGQAPGAEVTPVCRLAYAVLAPRGQPPGFGDGLVVEVMVPTEITHPARIATPGLTRAR